MMSAQFTTKIRKMETRGAALFKDDADYERFIARLSERVEQFAPQPVSVCLHDESFPLQVARLEEELAKCRQARRKP
jgi:hypothetical protein